MNDEAGRPSDTAEAEASEAARLATLLSDVQRFAAADYSRRASVGPAGDEIDALAAGINMLVEEIRFTQSQLERKVEESAALAGELAESLSSKTTLLDTVSHELRAPLTAISGFAQVLLQRSSSLPTEQADDLVRRIERNARRLTALVNDLLEVSSLSQGRVAGEPTAVHVATLLHETVDDLGFEHDTVTVSSDEDLWALVDARHLTQIVTNLLTNAVKYGRPPVRIDATGAMERVLVTVTDAGDGLPPGMAGRLFDPFEQGIRGAPLGGFGLGLWIVRLLAEGNQGTVTYRPAEPVGGCFEVALQRTSPAALLARSA